MTTATRADVLVSAAVIARPCTMGVPSAENQSSLTNRTEACTLTGTSPIGDSIVNPFSISPCLAPGAYYVGPKADQVSGPDANTADGRDVYVLAADVAVADLNDAPPDVAVPPGSKAVIDSQHLTVTIDKATWLLATERIDLSFHIGSTAGNETLATTFSDLNQPVHFPSDMPASCSNTTT